MICENGTKYNVRERKSFCQKLSSVVNVEMADLTQQTQYHIIIILKVKESYIQL